MSEQTPCRRLEVVLVRPSKYDDDGYVIRYWKGVLPSNTLCCLYSLTKSVAESGRFAGRAEIHVHTIDETVEPVRPERVARRLKREGTRVLVGIVGVQTNQFPRAADLARRFAAAGCKVMIGGFHVSGSLAMFEQVRPELQEMLDLGVTLVQGEVENVWGDILEDVIERREQPIYRIDQRPELDTAPVPELPPHYVDRFVFKHYATIDTSRGCPFGCSFCTVINVQGRKMRFRSPELILRRIRENYREGKGIFWYIFTDDNLARNQHWERIFDGMIRMRQEEGIVIDFMMQVDVKAHRLPNFARKAAEAGCTQVFTGVESVDPENLVGAGKDQNSVENYAEMVEKWHENGVHVHGAYIIGFPNDTYDSVMAAVDRLKGEIKLDQVSFFMLTPLPGSEDHVNAVAAGVAMNSDYNEYDSFHALTDHPKMSREDWLQAYRDAWERFYTLDNMKEILLRIPVHDYWGMFKGLLWYRAGMVENQHPMLTGLFRLKDRTERRPGFAVDSRWAHLRKRSREIRWLMKQYGRLFFEFQELWLQTRIPSEKLRRLDAIREHLEVQLAGVRRNLEGAKKSIGGSVAHVRAAIDKNLETLKINMPAAGEKIRLAGGIWWHRAFDRVLLSPCAVSTRKHLDHFWSHTRQALRRGRIWKINPVKLCGNFVRDLRMSISFSIFLLHERVI